MRQNLLERTYQRLAPEYYDDQRHPTCANFRWASEAFLRDWTAGLDLGMTVVEVGAGRSLLAKLLLSAWEDLRRLVLLDSSENMLQYSKTFRRWGAQLTLGDACSMPFLNEAFDLVASVLGDAYNNRTFWSEVRRVMRPNGIALFTTPSFGWAAAFRPRELAYVAEFLLGNGQIVTMPSHIYRQDQQIELIESSGLLVKDVIEIPMSVLGSRTISPKLLPSRGTQASVVTGYVATKS